LFVGFFKSFFYLYKAQQIYWEHKLNLHLNSSK
jgi:hypothetical protein